MLLVNEGDAPMGQFGLRAQKYTQRVPLGKRVAEPMKRVRLKRLT